jgi:hypothetical protein
MSFKNQLLTESEKDLIREMYGLLSEQYFKAPNGGTGQVINKYPAGYYSLSGADKSGTPYDNTTSLQKIIDNAKEFLTTNKGYIPRVVINAGESIIPNYDSEGGTGKKNTGWLSEQRKNKISVYIKSQLKDLVAKKLISREPEILLYFDEAKTLTIPSGGWDDYRTWKKSSDQEKSANPKNAEYTKLKTGYDTDQKTIINFKIVPDLGENQCSFNVKIGVHYDDLSLGHQCNKARFKILANGVPLTTTLGTTCGAGLAYADMNNGSGSLDCKKNADFGGKRMNYFQLNSASVVNKIMAASPDKNSIKITMECTSTGFDDAAGRCHQDVPHITIHNTDGLKTVDTYPKVNDAKLIIIDKCGNLISGGGGAPTKSADAKGGTTTTGGTTTKTTGKKLNFASPATGTITSDQAIVNKISSGEVSKNPDGTYSVLKNFSYGGLNYVAGDTIVKILPKGSSLVTTTTTTIKQK